MENFHYIVEWITAVFEHWEGWVSGGVIGFSLELWKRFREWEPNKKVFAGLVIAGFLFSIFSSWKDERIKYEEEAKKQEPLLHAEVIDKVTGPIQTSNKKDKSHVLLRIALFNSGAQSVAGGWTLTVNGQSQVKCDRARIPEPLVLGPQLVFHESQAMYSKTEETPLQRGARQTGLVWFWCDAPVEVINKNSETLRFQDVNLKWWSAQVEPGPREETLPYVPGLTP